MRVSDARGAAGRTALAIAFFAILFVAAVSTSRPADAPPGFVAKGTLTIDVAPPSAAPMHLAGEFDYESRDQLSRLDIVSISLPPGAPEFATTVAKGGLTIVIDRAASRWTLWSKARRLFAFGNLPKPSIPGVGHAATPKPETSESAMPRAAWPLAGVKDLKSFFVHLDMSGHGTTNGHPSTGFTLAVHREDAAGKVGDINGTLQTADDLDGLPIKLTADLRATDQPRASLAAELTEVGIHLPPRTDFFVPRGYKAAKNVGEVLGFGGMF